MNYNCRRTLFLAMACLLCVAGYAGASTRATSGMASDGGTAHLIIYRIPTIGKFVIGWYLAHYALSSAYGAAGAIVVVMLWIYWSSALFFVGAVVAHLADQRAGRMADVAARTDPPLHPAPETPA